jgi:hypothetical protein
MKIFDAHISGSLSVSASAEISNNLSVSGNLNVLGTINGSVSGNTTSADTASFAPKYTLTSSFNTFTSSYTTGSFTGSFKGDGTNLYNIPASGVTGLNLTRIADGVATASISNANGLRVNSNTEITGAFNLNNMTLGVDKTISITVTDSSGKYYINGVSNPRLTFVKGFKYRFYNTNNGTHPILFSTTDDGTHNGGTEYTTGVTENVSPYYIEIDITKDTPTTLYYYCDHHTGMGNSISVTNDVLNNVAGNNLVYIDPTRLATTGSNTFIGAQNVSGSVNLTGSLNITGSISLNGVPVGTGKLDETTFNTYTSSNDSTNTTQNSRLTSIESATSSLNSFTSSIDNTIKNKLNTEAVITSSIQVLITGTTGYSTFSSSISTSIGSLSSSVATTTSGLSSSIGSLSSSVNSLSSSIATTTSGLSSSIATTTSGLSSSIGSLSSSVATTTLGLSSSIVSLSSSFLTTTNTLSSSIGSLSSSVATTTNGLSSSIGSLSSSVAITTLNTRNRVDSIETSTGSLNSFTSSINTTIKTKLDSESVISGSVQVNITGTTGYSAFSSSVATTTSGLSSSVATTTSGLSSSIGSLSSSVATTTSGLSSSIGSLSSSVATTTLGTKNRVDSIEAKTGSYATTGSNIFQGSQTITGSLYISQDLIVAGSSSIQHISSSIVNIADNIITVNASNPSLRFGGLAVIDSGSSPQVSGSMLFDSIENQWIFIHQNQATVTSSMLIMGPETYDNVGNETHLTLNRLLKSVNDEHIGDSNITDTGTKVSINSNTEVTGTLKVTGNITNPNITAIESATGSLNTFTSSLLTAIELTGSNLTVRGNFLVKGTTTNVNTTTLDVDNNLINLNGNGASFSGIRVKDTTGPNLVSGSLLWDASNDYWIGGQLGSEQRLVRETEFNNAVTRIGNVETSTGSLNSFTSSINTTIKTKLNTEGVLSGSIQVNHNATTNYVANQHIDHTTVSITAGSGLTGGGDISATRTINIGAGNGITVNADDIAIDTASATFTTGVKSKLNADGVISGSAQVLNGTTIHSGSFFNGIAVVSGSAQIDGSQLGSNKTITIGSTSTTLGGTSTSLIGLTSVTSTAFTGSLRGDISGNAGTVTNGVYTTGDQTIGGIKTFSSAITASNYSGTHTGASSGTNTGDETLARVNALAITTVGTITSGIWNGTAIANGNLANSSFNIGTTSISLGRASASQTLTGVSIDGASATSPLLTSSGTFTTEYGSGTVGYQYAFNSSTTGLFTAVDNSNSVLTVNRHPGSYYSQLGFSSNGNLYYRSFSATAINTSQAWKTIIDSGNIGSQTVTNVSGTVAVANGGTGGTTASAARTNLGLAIGTDVLAYRTFGTAAASATGDFAAFNATTYVGTTAIALNRASASQTLTGVSIDGNAATATSADQIDGVGFRNTGSNSAIAANTLDSNGITYVTNVDGSSTNLTGNATDGALYSQAYSSDWQHQIYGDYRTGIMYARGKNSGTWQSWKRVALSSSTTFSSVSSLTFTHNLGTANVTAQVFDSNGDMFFPSNIRVSSTQVIVTFASARSGRLVVTG